MSAGILLAALAGFQVKHLLGDYALQSGAMIAGKGIYGNPAGLAHAAVHGALSLPVLLWAGAGPAAALALAAAEIAVHYHIDWLKARAVEDRGLGPGSRAYWIAYGIDQALHQLTYLAMIWAVLAA